MKSTVWRKFKLSKYKFPTHQVQGSGGTKGANVPGFKAAAEFLKRSLGGERVAAMVQTSTRFEWVFKEALNKPVETTV